MEMERITQVLLAITLISCDMMMAEPVRVRRSTDFFELRKNSTNLEIILPEYIIKEYPNGSLWKIDCKNCGLTKLVDSNFIGAPNLIDLLLNSNKIKIVDGNMFKGLDNLKQLDISENQIEVLQNDLLKYLPNLKIFLALHNRIHHIDSNTFDIVKFIDISYNPIVELNLNFRYIYMMELLNCQLKKVTLNGIVNELYMGRNEIIELNLLKNSNLTGIDLRCNNLASSVIKSIDGKMLRRLMLNGTKLDYEYLGHDIFKSMPHLSMLELSFTNLTNISELLRPLKELVYLDINSNNIREFDLTVLNSLRRLKKIIWQMNPWRCLNLKEILLFYTSPKIHPHEIRNMMNNSTICTYD